MLEAKELAKTIEDVRPVLPAKDFEVRDNFMPTLDSRSAS